METVTSMGATVSFDLKSSANAEDVLAVEITGYMDSTVQVHINDKNPKIKRHEVEDVLQDLSEIPVTVSKVQNINFSSISSPIGRPIGSGYFGPQEHHCDWCTSFPT